MKKFIANYAPVNEDLARRAKENISFSDYKQGTATAHANYYTNEIVKYANELLERNPTEDSEKLEKVQYYIDKYSQKIAAAIDKETSITCRCPSVLITGGGNFPVRKKEKQNAAAEAHWRATKELYETDSNNYYFNKIRLILTDSGIIKSDDPKAVEKIKAKIAKLETLPDPYGNKKAEMRRLKERLLQLAPEEVKQGKEITINGEPATFESIVKIFDNVKPQKSQYSSTDESYYLPMVELVFSDGSRKYKEYLSNQVNEDLTQIFSYKTMNLVPFTDIAKFTLVISKIHGSGSKAVIYQILKDLDPRIAAVKAEAKEQKQEDRKESIKGEDVTVKENTELMCLQVFFEGVPAKETREILKSNGFKWAPSQGAWQRLLNDNAKRALTDILDK